MHHKPWDVEVGSGTARSGAETAATALVRTPSRHHGVGDTQALAVATEDARGTVAGSLTGDVLVDWVELAAAGSSIGAAR